MSLLDRYAPWRLRRENVELYEALGAAERLASLYRSMLERALAPELEADRERVLLALAEGNLEHETRKLAENGIAQLEQHLAENDR